MILQNVFLVHLGHSRALILSFWCSWISLQRRIDNERCLINSVKGCNQKSLMLCCQWPCNASLQLQRTGLQCTVWFKSWNPRWWLHALVISMIQVLIELPKDQGLGIFIYASEVTFNEGRRVILWTQLLRHAICSFISAVLPVRSSPSAAGWLCDL